MNRGYIFNKTYYNDSFQVLKTEKIDKLKTITNNLNELAKHGYHNENINKFISETKKHYEVKLNMIRTAVNAERIRDIEDGPDYLVTQLKYLVINHFYHDCFTVLFPDKYDAYGEVSSFYEYIKDKDMTLSNEESLRNYIILFSAYTDEVRKVNEIVMRERRRFANIYSEELDLIKEKIMKNKTYDKFSQVYINIIEKIKVNILKYIYSNDFPKHSEYVNKIELDRMIEQLHQEIEVKKDELINIVVYMEMKMMKLKSITPNKMTAEEKDLYAKLNSCIRIEEFDNLYALIHSMFIDHMYNDEKLKENIKTKKVLNVIKRKIDTKFKQTTSHLIESHQTTPKYIRDYLYSVLQRVIDDNSVSFDQRAIAKITFCDFSKDSRVINEAINGNNVVSENNIYIPRLDNKMHHRKVSYPLVELTFNSEDIEVNDLTQYGKINGEPSIDYDKFIYQYISLDTYIKKATYIGKQFIKNNFNKTDSQDFSNSTLYLNYNGVLLILTNGEYEIVSHETITMAGYDIPEANPIKSKADVKFIDEKCKKVITENIVNFAGFLKDEEDPLEKVNIMKPITLKSL